MAFFRKNITLIIVVLLLVVGAACRIWVSQLNWMHYDENYYLNITQNYIARGEITPYMWRLGDLPIIAGGGSGYGIFLLIAGLRAVGNSLFWGRILMAAVNLITAGVIYWVARKWWTSHLAGLAAFGYAIVATSSFNTLIVKMDALGILSYTLVLLLYVYAHPKERFWLHFLVGAGIVATAEFHILGVTYMFALAACYGYDLLHDSITNRRLVIRRSIWGFAVGALSAGSLYLAIHVLPDPKAYFVISQTCFECNENILVTEGKRLLRLLAFRPHEVLILLTVIILALKRKKDADRRYLVLAIGWLLGQALAGSPPYDHYFNHSWPILAIGVGGAVAFGSNYKSHPLRIPTSITAGFALLAVTAGMYLTGSYPSLLTYKLDPGPAVLYIQQNIEKDETVMGNVPNYYYLRDFSNYLAYRDGSVYGTILRGEDMLAFWRRTQPKAILLDQDLIDQDVELQQYIAEEDFEQILPDLWVR